MALNGLSFAAACPSPATVHYVSVRRHSSPYSAILLLVLPFVHATDDATPLCLFFTLFH